MTAFWNALKTIMLTTIIAGLVWLFAEAETLRDKEVDVRLILQPKSNSDLVVDVQGTVSREFTVKLRLQGGSLRMDQAERQLTDLPVILTLGDEGVPASTGEHRIDLMSALRSHETLRELAVSLQSVEPKSLGIVVDEFMTRELAIHAIPPADAIGLEFASTPIISPPRARVTLPRRDAERIGTDATLEAHISKIDFDRLTTGRQETLTNVRLRLPALANAASSGASNPTNATTNTPLRATINPTTVDIQLVVRQRSAEFLLPRVPIDLRLPASELGKWSVSIPEDELNLTDVRVVGPAELIQQVRDGRIPVRAAVNLSFDELARGVNAKDAVFTDVPDGLRFEVSDRQVRMTIRPVAPK